MGDVIDPPSVAQVSQAFDDSVSQEVTNHLFQGDRLTIHSKTICPHFFQILLFPEPGARFGMDLVSLNIQRGREHGIPSYNRWREWCGLHTINTWDDLLSVMANHSVRGYAEVPQSFHPPVVLQLSS